MNCCGSDSSQKPKQDNNSSPMEESAPKAGTLNQVVKWGLILILIAGLLSWLI